MAKNPNENPAPRKERWYYKSKEGRGFLNLKSPLSAEELVNYDEITKEEFDALTYREPVAPREPTAEEIHNAECLQAIAQHKAFLSDTDYVVLKLAEALANKDTALVNSIKEEYADVLAQRNVARAAINQLESEIVPVGDAPVSDPVAQGVEIPDVDDPVEEPVEEPVPGDTESHE